MNIPTSGQTYDLWYWIYVLGFGILITLVSCLLMWFMRDKDKHPVPKEELFDWKKKYE